MSKPYSQARALWAITRASFKAIFNQPVAVVFSLIFPIIFILIFGAFGSGGGPSYRICLAPGSDTVNPIVSGLKQHPQIRFVRYADSTAMKKDLERGRLTAIVTIQKIKDTTGKPPYVVSTYSTSASSNTFGGFMHALNYIKLKIEAADKASKIKEIAVIEEPFRSEVRKYRQIDFILPGQLGFSILFSTLFGIAFT
ncbi:MAG TPA: ABC transporter permease, partial [Chitinophagaceae bacterium]